MLVEKKNWLEKTANIIDQLVTKYHYSQACIDAKQGDVLFDDTCNYCDLVFELNELATTLRGIVKFGELSEHKPEKK